MRSNPERRRIDGRARLFAALDARPRHALKRLQALRRLRMTDRGVGVELVRRTVDARDQQVVE